MENYLIDIGGPENYKFDSTKNVYWLCSKCGTHYRMSIDDRVINDKRHHEACWKCNGRMKNNRLIYNRVVLYYIFSC